MAIFFLVHEGRENPNTNIGPPTFRWRANCGPTLNAGLEALRFSIGSGQVFQRNPIFL